MKNCIKYDRKKTFKKSFGRWKLKFKKIKILRLMSLEDLEAP
jgi:hypothetical protein